MSIAPETDDPTISDEAQLWRRINPQWIIDDENQGAKRVTSQAFHDARGADRLSVLLAERVLADGRGPQDVVRGLPGYCLAGFIAGLARRLEQIVVRAPELGEPAHCHVIGEKSKKVSRALAAAATWVIPPV